MKLGHFVISWKILVHFDFDGSNTKTAKVFKIQHLQYIIFSKGSESWYESLCTRNEGQNWTHIIFWLSGSSAFKTGMILYWTHVTFVKVIQKRCHLLWTSVQLKWQNGEMNPKLWTLLGTMDTHAD